jgi:hypothetical protein
VDFHDLFTGKRLQRQEAGGVVSSLNFHNNDSSSPQLSWTTDSGMFELYDSRIGTYMWAFARLHTVSICMAPSRRLVCC